MSLYVYTISLMCLFLYTQLANEAKKFPASLGQIKTHLFQVVHLSPVSTVLGEGAKNRLLAISKSGKFFSGWVEKG